MTEQGLLRLRGLLGWLAAACCLLAGLGLADSFVASFRTGPNTFPVVAGHAESLAAPLPPEVPDASAMLATIDRPGLTIETITQAQGFWMGNRMWQATVNVAPDAPAGTATITLRAPDAGKSQMPPQTFFLAIYPDQKSLDAAAESRFRRHLGLSPMAAAAWSLAAAALVGFCVFLTSRRLEALWAKEGKAVVYMTKKTPDGLLISFGLGSEHGLTPGATVAVHDESGLPVAMASIVRCSGDDAAALVVGDGKVNLGNIVSRPTAGQEE